MTPDRKPSILIAVNDGMQSRYLLRSSVFAELRKSHYQLIIATPNPEEPYFRAEFDLPGVKLIGLRKKNWHSDAWQGRLETFLRRVRLYSAPINEPGSILNIKLEEAQLERNMGRLAHGLFQILSYTLKRSKTLRACLLWMEGKLLNPKLYADVFAENIVHTVVTPSPGFVYIHDAYLLREARERGIPSICAIPMWDHPSTKGYMAAKADQYLVWGPSMRNEWVNYQDGLPAKVSMTGTTVFDFYACAKNEEFRESFFSRYGLDVSRKLILFATISPIGFPYNPEIARFIAQAIQDDAFCEPCQLLIRIHPNHFRDDAEHGLEPYEALIREFSNIHLSIPNIASSSLLGDMPQLENIEIGNMVRQSNVMINLFSTMQLDACICDTPVVNIGFRLGSNCIPSKDPDHFEHYVHLSRIVEQGSTRIAHSWEDVLSFTNDYLRNPDLQSAERRLTIEQEIGLLDGLAGKRIAERILQNADDFSKDN